MRFHTQQEFKTWASLPAGAEFLPEGVMLCYPWKESSHGHVTLLPGPPCPAVVSSQEVSNEVCPEGIVVNYIPVNGDLWFLQQRFRAVDDPFEQVLWADQIRGLM